MDKLFGIGTPVQLVCFQNGITNHRKFKAKWKDIGDFEYTDSSGTKAKLSKDEIEEFAALYPFKNHLQNELGQKTKNPVDITQYSREDFLTPTWKVHVILKIRTNMTQLTAIQVKWFRGELLGSIWDICPLFLVPPSICLTIFVSAPLNWGAPPPENRTRSKF